MKRRRKSSLFRKKELAHDIIRELEQLGMRKSIVYLRLSRMLKLHKTECHFAQMKTVDEVNRGITALQQIKTSRLQKIKKQQMKEEELKRHKVKERKILEQGTMQKLTHEVGKLNTINFNRNFADAYVLGFRKIGRTPIFKDLCKDSNEDFLYKKIFKDKLRNFFAYLTRYQIVDTWKIHDECGY